MATPKEFNELWGNPEGERISALTEGGFKTRDEQRRQEQSALRAGRDYRMLKSRLRRWSRGSGRKALWATQKLEESPHLMGGGGIASSEANIEKLYTNRFPDSDSAWSKLTGRSQGDSLMGSTPPAHGAGMPDEWKTPADGIFSGGGGIQNDRPVITATGQVRGERQYQGPMVGFEPAGGTSNILGQASALEQNRQQVAQRGFVDSVRRRGREIANSGRDITEDEIENMKRGATALGFTSEQVEELYQMARAFNEEAEWARAKGYADAADGTLDKGYAITNDPKLDGTKSSTGRTYRYQEAGDMSRRIPEQVLRDADALPMEFIRDRRDKQAERGRNLAHRAKIEAKGGLANLLGRGTDWSKVPKKDQVEMIMDDYNLSKREATNLLDEVINRASSI